MSLIEKISTERIEEAIAKLRSPDYGKTVQLFTYPVDPDLAVIGQMETTSYTLPDLYRELARRFESNVQIIRDALDTAAAVFEENEQSA